MVAKIPAAGVSLDGAVVVNESSADVDTRIESNANTHMLFVDGGNNRVGIGTTPDLGVGLHIRTADSGAATHTSADELVIENAGHAGISILSATDSTGNIFFLDSGGLTGYVQYDQNTNAFAIGTNGSTKMAISTVGAVKIDSDGLASGATGDGDFPAFALSLTNGQSSNAYGIYLKYDGGTPDNDSQYAFLFQDNTTNRCIIFNDGDIKNHDNTFGSLSDERIKQNIVDANSQWDDIKNFKVRNFKKKDDVRQYGEDKAPVHLGLIAQEAKAVSPGLVNEVRPSHGDIQSNSVFGTLYEDGDTIPDGKKIGDVKEEKEKVLGIKYSILYMKAIKALQEAMTKIETLETKVKALEDA